MVDCLVIVVVVLGSEVVLVEVTPTEELDICVETSCVLVALDSVLLSDVAVKLTAGRVDVEVG